MPKKSVEKSAQSVDKPKRPLRGAAADRSKAGRGPAKGAPNAGRPPDAWKAKMRELADRGAQAAEAHRVLEDPEHPHWMKAWQFVTEQAHGKATQPMDVSGDGVQVVIHRAPTLDK